MRSILAFLILTGLLALLFSVACEVEPEITVDDVDVTLDHATDPFAIKSQLTPEQASGNADVLVSYGAITHLIGDNKGPISRTPGKVVAWRDRQVEVLYSRKDGDNYVRVWVDYGEDFDTGNCMMIRKTSHVVDTRSRQVGRCLRDAVR